MALLLWAEDSRSLIMSIEPIKYWLVARQYYKNIQFKSSMKIFHKFNVTRIGLQYLSGFCRRWWGGRSGGSCSCATARRWPSRRGSARTPPRWCSKAGPLKWDRTRLVTGSWDGWLEGRALGILNEVKLIKRSVLRMSLLKPNHKIISTQRYFRQRSYERGTMLSIVRKESPSTDKRWQHWCQLYLVAFWFAGIF